MEQVAQGGSGGPIPGDVQGQGWWSSEKSDLVDNVPAYDNEKGLHNPYRSLPTQCTLILWFESDAV